MTDPETTARAVDWTIRILTENFDMSRTSAVHMATDLVDALQTRFHLESVDTVIPNAPPRSETGIVLSHAHSSLLGSVLHASRETLHELYHVAADATEKDMAVVFARHSVEKIENDMHAVTAACDIFEVLVKSQRCSERALEAKRRSQG